MAKRRGSWLDRIDPVAGLSGGGGRRRSRSGAGALNKLRAMKLAATKRSVQRTRLQAAQAKAERDLAKATKRRDTARTTRDAAKAQGMAGAAARAAQPRGAKPVRKATSRAQGKQPRKASPAPQTAKPCGWPTGDGADNPYCTRLTLDGVCWQHQGEADRRIRARGGRTGS